MQGRALGAPFKLRQGFGAHSWELRDPGTQARVTLLEGRCRAVGQGRRLGPGCGGRGAGPRSAAQPPASLFHPETATTGTPPRRTRLCTDPDCSGLGGKRERRSPGPRSPERPAARGGGGGTSGAASGPVGGTGAPATEYSVEVPPQIPSRRAGGPAAPSRGRLRGGAPAGAAASGQGAGRLRGGERGGCLRLLEAAAAPIDRRRDPGPLVRLCSARGRRGPWRGRQRAWSRGHSAEASKSGPERAMPSGTTVKSETMETKRPETVGKWLPGGWGMWVKGNRLPSRRPGGSEGPTLVDDPDVIEIC